MLDKTILARFKRKERKQIFDQIYRAYVDHLKACAADELEADDFDHFAFEWVEVFQAELIQAPAPFDTDQISHDRRDYSEIYRAPIDVSLI